MISNKKPSKRGNRNRKRKRAREAAAAAKQEGRECPQVAASLLSSRKKNAPPCHVFFWDDDTTQTPSVDAIRSSLKIPPALDVTCFQANYFRKEEASADAAAAAAPNTAAKQRPDSIDADSWERLLQLWSNFCRNASKKKQQQPGTSRHCPTPIQLQSWSLLLALQKVSLLQTSPTGSGKTLAYSLPLLVQAASSSSSSSAAKTSPMVAVVLVPTRELARQVQAECSRVVGSVNNKGHRSVHIVALYGGVDKTKQQSELKQHLLSSDDDTKDTNSRCPSSLLIAATPGRLLDILGGSVSTTTSSTSTHSHDDDSSSSSTSDSSAAASNEKDKEDYDDDARFVERLTSRTTTVVLDEADRLAVQTDLRQQCQVILNQFLHHRARTILCSATWPAKANPIWKQWIGPQNPCVVIQVDALESAGLSNKVAKTVPRSMAGDDQEGSTVPVAGAAVVSNERRDKDDMASATTGSAFSSDEGNQQHPDSGMSRIPAHVTQVVHVCSHHKKPRKLIATLRKAMSTTTASSATVRNRQPRGIVFFAKIATLQYCCQLLQKQGVRCSPLHSHMKQVDRERAVQNFSAGKCPVLLATDIAARGLHVNAVRFIVQYDMAGNLEQYIHRCGRAGRGMQQRQHGDGDTSEGVVAYSFFTRELAPLAPDLVTLLRSTQQVVDPNLVALAKEWSEKQQKRMAKQTAQSNDDNVDRNDNNKKVKTQHRANVKKPAVVAASRNQPPDPNVDDDDDDEQAFAALAGNRIVLQRASHVSDASSSSEDDDDENE